jgi:ribosomal protein S18 acetylase RimI-like enzyme
MSRRSIAGLAKSPSALLLVAVLGREVAGYAALLTRRGSRNARLYSIAVKPGAAGRGVGSGLLGAAEAEASRRGAQRMRLEVRADNTAAIQFYGKAGYSRTGQRQHYYEDGMTALLLARTLTNQTTAAPTSALVSRAA